MQPAYTVQGNDLDNTVSAGYWIEDQRASGASAAILSVAIPNIDVLPAVQGDLGVAVYNNATMHTPLSVTREALAIAEQKNVDCVVSAASLVVTDSSTKGLFPVLSFQVAIGGGSTIGLGKALALHSDGRIKQIAIPTTCAQDIICIRVCNH